MMKKVLPNSFVYLSSIDPTIQKSIRCASTENFSGNVVRGYENAKDVIIKEKAARQLKEVQAYMRSQGYTLVIYDAYRPRRAVEYFVEWSKNADTSTQASVILLILSICFPVNFMSFTSSISSLSNKWTQIQVIRFKFSVCSSVNSKFVNSSILSCITSTHNFMYL